MDLSKLVIKQNMYATLYLMQQCRPQVVTFPHELVFFQFACIILLNNVIIYSRLTQATAHWMSVEYSIQSIGEIYFDTGLHCYLESRQVDVKMYSVIIARFNSDTSSIDRKREMFT